MLIAPSVAVSTAISADAALLAWSAERPRSGRVHSVFRRVINVAVEGDGLVALAHRSIDDAPWTARIDRFGELVGQVRVGDRVEFSAAGARIIGAGIAFELAFDGPAPWSSAPADLGGFDAAALARAADRLERLIRADGRPSGLPAGANDADAAADAGDAADAAPRANRTPFEVAAAAALADRAGRLIDAIRDPRTDDAALDGALADLIGLGPGLTPAGDDFVAGLAYIAAGSTTRLGGLPAVVLDRLDAAPDATTPLARVTVREAALGRVRDHVGAAVRVALEASAPAGDAADAGGSAALATRTAVLRVIRIGHTSGTDLLSGVAAGLRLESELRGSH